MTLDAVIDEPSWTSDYESLPSCKTRSTRSRRVAGDARDRPRGRDESHQSGLMYRLTGDRIEGT
jgi:hypothetical protein